MILAVIYPIYVLANFLQLLLDRKISRDWLDFLLIKDV